MGAIQNKIAIVTGGGGGIGGAIARRFARKAPRSPLRISIRKQRTRSAAELTAQGADAIPLVADVTNKKAVGDMVQAALDRWRRIDILVNVAGGAERKPVIDMTAADWDHVVDMNLKSVFLCSQAVLPVMLKQKYGKIVNISSIYGYTGNATRSSYSAAKAGVVGVHQITGVGSMSATASISTPSRLAASLPQRVRSHFSDEAWAAAEAQIPMGRTGDT